MQIPILADEQMTGKKNLNHPNSHLLFPSTVKSTPIFLAKASDLP